MRSALLKAHGGMQLHNPKHSYSRLFLCSTYHLTKLQSLFVVGQHNCESRTQRERLYADEMAEGTNMGRMHRDCGLPVLFRFWTLLTSLTCLHHFNHPRMPQDARARQAYCTAWTSFHELRSITLDFPRLQVAQGQEQAEVTFLEHVASLKRLTSLRAIGLDEVPDQPHPNAMIDSADLFFEKLRIYDVMPLSSLQCLCMHGVLCKHLASENLRHFVEMNQELRTLDLRSGAARNKGKWRPPPGHPDMPNPLGPFRCWQLAMSLQGLSKHLTRLCIEMPLGDTLNEVVRISRLTG